MKEIVFLDTDTFPPNFSFARPEILHNWVTYSSTTSKEVCSRIRDAHVVLSNKVPLREKEILAAKKLELIVLTATGFDHVDLKFAKNRGIAVANCVNYGTPSIAEHTFMLMLMLARNALGYTKQVANGVWQKSSIFCFFGSPVFELRNKVLTICGMGNVGSELNRMAEAFGMHVVKAERKGVSDVRKGYTEFKDAVANADFISLHLPLNLDTKHLFANEEFQSMKKSAYLVNVARGNVVDELACAGALLEKNIAGAAFDVLSNEPPLEDNARHPLLKLMADDDVNLIVTPHVAWAGEVSLATIVGQCSKNIDAFYRGEKLRRLV